MSIDIRRYEAPTDKDRWDEFIATSARNATFLHCRGYMDYHSDRFNDMSLMAYKGTRLIGVIPGNCSGNTFHSHSGLTYGGLLTSPRATMADVADTFSALNRHLKDSGIKEVIYKPVPHIYHQCPSEEDLYALFSQCGASLETRAVSSVIDSSHRLRFFDIRRSGIRKATKAGVTISENTSFDDFWPILSANLMERHGTVPVHTLAEITLLRNRFPDNIRLFEARLDSACLAGVVMYVTPKVAHAQYISASHDGKACGALDLLFDYLINNEFSSQDYFDFGISTEQGGRLLNHSLLYQKEGFGARAVCYDSYRYSV